MGVVFSLRRLRVGVVGCGWVAQNYHIPNYIRNPKSEIVAICDPNEEVLDKISEKYGIRFTFMDSGELFEKDLIDAVSICTPTKSHCEIATHAAEYGVHTLCEKPLASSVEEADKILNAVSRNNIKFMVGFNLRFLPNHRKMKEYLLSGKIGKPISARGEIVAVGAYRDNRQKDVTYETEKRIGALFDLGAHMADLFIWILGRPIEVSAFVSTYKEGIHVDDSASVLIKFESGVIGNMVTLWADLPDYEAMVGSRTIEIVGERGKIESDFFGPSLHFYSRDSLASRIKGKITITPGRFNPKNPGEALEWSYRREIECFLNSIVEDKEPPVSGVEARQALKLILAAYKSNETRSAIKLD